MERHCLRTLPRQVPLAPHCLGNFPRRVPLKRQCLGIFSGQLPLERHRLGIISIERQCLRTLPRQVPLKRQRLGNFSRQVPLGRHCLGIFPTPLPLERHCLRTVRRQLYPTPIGTTLPRNFSQATQSYRHNHSPQLSLMCAVTTTRQTVDWDINFLCAFSRSHC